MDIMIILLILKYKNYEPFLWGVSANNKKANKHAKKQKTNKISKILLSIVRINEHPSDLILEYNSV